MKVDITFQPVIYKDDSLNKASMGIGTITLTVHGNDKESLFLNIEKKIWSMSCEAKVLDEELALEYNKWEANRYRMEVPQETNGVGYFALPYSDSYKKYLRGNKI